MNWRTKILFLYVLFLFPFSHKTYTGYVIAWNYTMHDFFTLVNHHYLHCTRFVIAERTIGEEKKWGTFCGQLSWRRVRATGRASHVLCGRTFCVVFTTTLVPSTAIFNVYDQVRRAHITPVPVAFPDIAGDYVWRPLGQNMSFRLYTGFLKDSGDAV